MAGSSILPIDMRRADLAYGSPELMLAGIGAVDYFNSIGLPCWVGAGASDAHVPDLQAAAEVGANMALAALAETGFVHRLGFLSGGRTGSLEMLVLCDELASMTNGFAQGVVVDEDTLAKAWVCLLLHRLLKDMLSSASGARLRFVGRVRGKPGGDRTEGIQGNDRPSGNLRHDVPIGHGDRDRLQGAAATTYSPTAGHVLPRVLFHVTAGSAAGAAVAGAPFRLRLSWRNASGP